MRDTDLELLARYAHGDSQDAFGELVRRHLNLVYCAALRQVRSPQLAEEIVQSVFADLARHAASFAPDTVLSAWLYEVTRRTAVDVIRRKSRRQQREQLATEMNTLANAPDDWRHIEPLLDEAMHALDTADRAAVLLRFFEGRSFREVGAALGISDDTAQKRVSRALDRLREHFTKHGVTIGSGALATVLSANAVQSAPAALAALVAATAGGALAGSTAAVTTTKALAMTMTQKTLITAGLAAAVALGVFQARHNAALNAENAALRRSVALAQTELERLQREQSTAVRSTAQATAPTQRDNKDAAELLRLRGEVARLRRDAEEAAAQLKQANADLIDAWSKVPPYKTLFAMANETLSRDQALVAGGWKTPDGRRALAFITTEPTDDGSTVTVTTKLIEYTEEAAEQMGLRRFQSGSGESMFGRTQVIPADEVRQLLEQLEKTQEVNVMTTPKLTTGNGRQGQVKVVNGRKLPNGEDYEVGPMLDFVPTVTADGQSVQLRMSAQINLPIPRPGQTEPPKE